MKIFDKIVQQYDEQLPFAVYNKPNSQHLVGFFQNNNSVFEVSTFEEIGFLFAPFCDGQTILILERESQILVEEINFDTKVETLPNIYKKESDDDKIGHINLIKDGITAIEAGKFDKVVLSRSEVVTVKTLHFINTFKNLVLQYPQAFCYCFYHPVVGLWLGAFSEQLLKVDNQNFSTISLAGTQKLSQDTSIIWQSKEINEQQIVTDYIVSKLENQVSEIQKTETKTILFGNLAHLITEISGRFKANVKLKDILRILHPTPAICGFPTDNARTFILNNENYNRMYYAGFVGELNKDFYLEEMRTDLFVNLRCMKIEGRQVTFFAGGGITIDSDPEKEWYETVNKIDTIKRCLA